MATKSAPAKTPNLAALRAEHRKQAQAVSRRVREVNRELAGMTKKANALADKIAKLTLAEEKTKAKAKAKVAKAK